MANSKYEYVKKSFETMDKIIPSMWIVFQLDGRNFHRFSDEHEFERPNDERALRLMNECAKAMFEEFPDIVFAYGFSDEYSFVFKKTTEFYNRRSSKINSIVGSFFASVYRSKWKEFFPDKNLKIPPSFVADTVCYPSTTLVQDYLAWRQEDCHVNNLYNTCFWKLVESGKTDSEAQAFLEGTRPQDKNEILFQECNLNYNDLPEIFRKGSCVFKDKVEETVKYNENGQAVKRLRNKVIVEHCDITGDKFWKDHVHILKDDTIPSRRVGKRNYEYLKSFDVEQSLMPSTWIVLRIDGRHFHQFSDKHEFEKPNDERALKLMNACAKAMFEEFPDIVFAYGVSDEYSFVFKETTELYNRRSSKIVSSTVTFFTSVYGMKWNDFFTDKDLKYPPSFDARVICYPSTKIVRDYVAWRQVDCHINNQYNTCYWELVKSGKTKSKAQEILKRTRTEDKYEILLKEFDMNYTLLPSIFRKGSCMFKDKVEETVKYNGNGQSMERLRSKVIVDHCDVIGDEFWEAHSHILNDETTPNLNRWFGKLFGWFRWFKWFRLFR